VRFSCSSLLDAGWANARSLPRYYGAGSWGHATILYKGFEDVLGPVKLMRDIRAFTPQANASIFRASLQWPIQTYALVIENGPVLFFPMYKGSLHVGSTNYYNNICYMGLQAGCIWNQTFDSAVTGWGFKRIPSNWCMYRHNTETGTIIFAVHVDDIFSIAHPPEENTHFKEQLHSKWEITDLGPAKFGLGIGIEHNHENHMVGLSQMAFIDQLIEHFNLSDAHTIDTPMIQGLQI